MADPKEIPIRAPTQAFLEIEDIKDNLVILKDGSCCMVLETTAINFGLLSEREQDALIFAYAALLNSLTFSIQLILRSQRKDISSYLYLLDEQIAKQKNKLLAKQMSKYRQYVEEIVKKNNVLDKQFYLIIPFSVLELGVGKTMTSLIRRKKGLPFDKDYIIERAKVGLAPRRDHLVRQFNRLGLKPRQLKTQELIQLFYNLYNPEGGTQVIGADHGYTAPLVEPATETRGQVQQPPITIEEEQK